MIDPDLSFEVAPHFLELCQLYRSANLATGIYCYTLFLLSIVRTQRNMDFYNNTPISQPLTLCPITHILNSLCLELKGCGRIFSKYYLCQKIIPITLVISTTFNFHTCPTMLSKSRASYFLSNKNLSLLTELEHK